MTTPGNTPLLQVRYSKGALLPSLSIDWYDSPAANAALVNFGGGTHTFAYTISKQRGTRTLANTGATCTGAAVSPNLVVDWSTGSIDTLSPGEYSLHIIATRTSDGKQRHLPQEIRITIDPVST